MRKTVNRVGQGLRILAIFVLCAYGIYYRAEMTNGARGIRSMGKIGMIAFLLAASLVMVLLPRREKEKKSRFSWLSLLYICSSPLVGYVAAEIVTTEPKPQATALAKLIGPSFHGRIFLFNFLVIALICLFFIAVTGSMKVGPYLGVMFIVLFATVNYYVFEFRGSGVTASDILAIETAMDVSSHYSVVLNYRAFLAFVICCFWWCLAYRLQSYPHASSWPLYLDYLVGGLCLFALCFRIFILTNFFSTMGIGISYWNVMDKSYRTKGTALILARSVKEAIPEKPKGYSAEKAKEIAERYMAEAPSEEEEEEKVLNVSPENPNVIVIIDEALKDLQMLGDFTVNEDPLPYLHGLSQEFPYGESYASVYGGRTANTEFEFLTGLTMGCLPKDSVPFQIYIRGETPSMANVMSEKGYMGIGAYHPHKEKNYNRNKAYPFLGFENCYFKDNSPVDLWKIRGFVSDESDYENVIAIYEQDRKESSAPWFFYNMTIQNHSEYTAKNFESTIHCEEYGDKYPAVDQYLSITKYSDEAFQKLVEYFENKEEPTVILLMGDHQPSLPEKFLNQVTKNTVYEGDFEEKYFKYNVEYYVWANFPLEQVDSIGSTSMNYMQLNLMKLIGAELTPFQRFLSELQQQVPIINVYGYKGADGKSYSLTNTNSPYYELVQEYFILCYNCLFDANHRVEGFFY